MGDTATPNATLGQKIVRWARDHKGQKVDRGECWDLAELALKNSGAKTSTDLGKVGADTDYVWGTLKTTSQVTEGDIIQYRNYKVVIETKVKKVWANGAWNEETETKESSAPHHTAIATGMADKDGRVNIIEQNSPPAGRKVQESTIYTRNVAGVPVSKQEQHAHPQTKKMESATVTTTVTIKFSGKLWVYTPIKKEVEAK